MNERRTEKFHKVVQQRQGNLTVILENVLDPHNVGAVLRSCDSVCIQEIFVVYTEPGLMPSRFKIGKRTSMGTRKWVDVNLYTDVEACFARIKHKYDLILSTHLDESSVSLYDLDLTQSVALLFGNEKHGLSETALSYSDGNFVIPQMGMAESLNISVACAVTLYEASRQRHAKNLYHNNTTTTPAEKKAIAEEYLRRHQDDIKNYLPKRFD